MADEELKRNIERSKEHLSKISLKDTLARSAKKKKEIAKSIDPNRIKNYQRLYLDITRC